MDNGDRIAAISKIEEQEIDDELPAPEGDDTITDSSEIKTDADATNEVTTDVTDSSKEDTDTTNSSDTNANPEENDRKDESDNTDSDKDENLNK